jgi:hypothetical protein
MVPTHLRRDEAELAIIRTIAASHGDAAVVMMNLNLYTPEAGYADGVLYRQYMAQLRALLGQVGARILWQIPVYGQVVGDGRIDEILAVLYPTHQAFLDLTSADGAQESYRLRGLCVARAVIHRCASFPV